MCAIPVDCFLDAQVDDQVHIGQSEARLCRIRRRDDLGHTRWRWREGGELCLEIESRVDGHQLKGRGGLQLLRELLNT